MKSTKTKTTTFRKKGKHITDAERQIIEKLYRKGVPVPKNQKRDGQITANDIKLYMEGMSTHYDIMFV